MFFKHKLGLIFNSISTELLRNLRYSRKPKKNSSQNYQGDIFRQIITTWNNLPGYLKEMPIQRSNFKKIIHNQLIIFTGFPSVLTGLFYETRSSITRRTGFDIVTCKFTYSMNYKSSQKYINCIKYTVDTVNKWVTAVYLWLR